MMMMMMMKNEANIMLSMYEYNIIYGNNMEREREAIVQQVDIIN